MLHLGSSLCSYRYNSRLRKTLLPAFPNRPFPRPSPDVTPDGPTLPYPEALVQASWRLGAPGGRYQGGSAEMSSAFPIRSAPLAK
jgi:hypothetical protein